MKIRKGQETGAARVTVLGMVVFAVVLVVLAGCVDRPGSPEKGPEEYQPNEATSYVQTRACIPVSVNWLSGTAEQVIVGDLFVPADVRDTTMLWVLVPGGYTPRAALDGTSQGIGHADDNTLARRLAVAGYGILLVDRLGIGESTPSDPLLGIEITTSQGVSAIAQVVADARSGAYLAGPSCEDAGPTWGRVGVLGHSYGGWIAAGVASQVAVDGAVILGAGMYGVAQDAAAWQAPCGVGGATDHPGVVTYAYGFCDDAVGFDQCVQWLTLPEHRDGPAALSYCKDLQATPEPLGIIQALPDNEDMHRWAAAMPGVPVLYQLYVGDRMIATDDDAPGTPSVHAQADEFESACSCVATTSIMEGTGHVPMMTTLGPQVLDGILEWMADAGFPDSDGQ